MNGRRPPAAAAWAGRVTMVTLLVAALVAPAAALGARLVGGRRQAAIARAFSAGRAHQGQTIVSIRASGASSAWSVVKSVRAQRAGRTSPGARPVKLLSTFFDLVGGRERSGLPPPAVRADLERDLRVAVLYTGTGAETIAYEQGYRSACAGAGGFVTQETDTVSPMSWRVRYVVNLDDVLAAVRSGPQVTIVPDVALDPAASRLSAVERITRQSLDAGCNGTTSRYDCTVAFHLPGSPLGGIFSLQPGDGTEIGVPGIAAASPPCDPDQLTLGPSLWASGGTTALVGGLGLVGGRLPANPYAPIAVSWPADAALYLQGFITSPCQDLPAGCSDSFSWRGHVQLAPA